MVATGQTDVGFADAPAAMQMRSKGAPVKIIAPILQTNGFAIISLEDTGIKRRRTSSARSSRSRRARRRRRCSMRSWRPTSIDKAKLNIVNIDPAAFVGALLEKKVDAILGGADFQSVQIRDRGFKVNDIFYRDVGVPTVGLSIIARDDRIEGDPELYRKFVAASLEGWDAARKNPDAAADAVIEQFPSATKDQILKQLNVDLLLVCAPGATTLGRVPDKNWQTTFDLLTKYLDLPKDKPIGDYYTNDFAAGQRAEVLTVQAPTAIEARPSRGSAAALDRRAAVSASGSPARRACSPRSTTCRSTSRGGEFVSLIGPSGCGKSTLMLIAAGLIPPSSGEIVVGGEVLRRPLTDVGIVFQDHLLLEFRSALDNVMLQAQIRRLAARAAPARSASRILGKLGIPARRRPLSAPTVRRHAAARLDRPRPDPPAVDPADGRAVRRARRDHADADPPRPRSCCGWRRARPCCSSPTASRKRSACPTGCW